jgi:hypothetical protein
MAEIVIGGICHVFWRTLGQTITASSAIHPTGMECPLPEKMSPTPLSLALFNAPSRVERRNQPGRRDCVIQQKVHW